jgi:hypothetical protein
MNYRRSDQCLMRNGTNNNHYAAFIYVTTCITLCTELLQMVKMFKLAYSGPWKLKRRSWIRNSEKVYIKQKWVDKSTCSKLPAECAGM